MRYARKNSTRISGHCFMAIFLPASLQLMMVSRQLSKSYVVSNLKAKQGICSIQQCFPYHMHKETF